MKQLKTLDGLALMPLYDWPELHHLTDAVWDCVRQAAREEGLDLPVGLDHRPQRVSAWMNDGVVFSQLCGSPWYRSHRHHARYLATSNFDLTDNLDGQYYSKIIVANDSPLHALDGLEQATFAFNDPDSQSGVHCLRPLLDIEPSLNRGVESGGHRFSIEAVADGRADFEPDFSADAAPILSSLSSPLVFPTSIKEIYIDTLINFEAHSKNQSLMISPPSLMFYFYYS